MIALKVALEQTAQQTKVLFLFVELDTERATVLQGIVDDVQRPPRIRVNVAAGKTVEQAFSSFLNFYKAKGQALPPTFAFIDPFGWKGVPFSIVQEVMKHQSCEVLVTFMYEEINRFLSQGLQGKNFDTFFGTASWRDCNSIADPQKRNRVLHDLYMEQLRTTARVKYVRSFQMRNDRDVTDYFLFYGTNNPKGLQKMKEAMWKVDSTGEFAFSDATDPNQMVLFGDPAVDVLQRQIVNRFSGHEVTVGQVEEFVLAETAFRETHYKKILKGLEMGQPQRLSVVNPPANRRAGTYALEGLLLRFANR